MNILRVSLAFLALGVSAWGANVTGKWKMTANTPDGNTHNVDLVVKEDSGKLAGELVSERGALPIQDVALNGDELTFKLILDVGPIPFKLKVDGDTMKGTITTPDGASGTVTAKREGAAPAAATTAGVTGKWKIVSKDPEGNEIRVTMDLKQEGEKLTGSMTLDSGDVAPIMDGKVTGSEVAFKIPTGEGNFEVAGTLNGSEIKGTYKTPNGSKGTFTGSK